LNSVKKKQKYGPLCRSKLFKVTEVGTNRKPVYATSFAYCCSNFGHFPFKPPYGEGLEATYTVQFRLIGKLVVDFLFVLNELFALGVTAEAL